MRESEALQGVKPIPAPAKQLNNSSVARQSIDAELRESPHKFSNLLLGRLESNVRSFPGIGVAGTFLNRDRWSGRHLALLVSLHLRGSQIRRLYVLEYTSQN